jgi:hypothetical protein
MKIKIISFIFIYILLCGCEPPICPDCYLETSAPNLEMDVNGYYHMNLLEDYHQTFTTLRAETGSDENYLKVIWKSNKEIWMGNQWINLVNGSSYTDVEGNAHTVLGVWPEFNGDTVIVYCGYVNDCNITFRDSIGVIIGGE